MRMLPFTFRSVEELKLGAVWQGVYGEPWPHYRAWFLKEGEAAAPGASPDGEAIEGGFDIPKADLEPWQRDPVERSVAAPSDGLAACMDLFDCANGYSE
jgi:hypothetical protein